MVSKIITIAIIVLVVLLILKLLRASAKVISFVIWLLVVSSLVYFTLPWLDPILQKVASTVPNGSTCYGLILESGDCFGISK